ncbi:hypothetical protein SAE02_21880 [Skermanella aerolata]|uniref:Uncharacterized protein n=1 Tax=Skermanella aerolata TaxID=393310 RepID=A0A512DPI0_9PROT|nr:hypothetical protein SAE02_21880 [Skermanella aerolata]
MSSTPASEYRFALDATPSITTEPAGVGSRQKRLGWFSKQFWLKPRACSPMILPPAKRGALLGMTVRLFRPKS